MQLKLDTYRMELIITGELDYGCLWYFDVFWVSGAQNGEHL